MKIILHPKKENLHRPVVALGTFDGVHAGHRKIISAAVGYAKKIGAHSAVLTFDPHPQQLVAPQRGLRCLTTLKEREELIRGLGADAVVVFKFDQRLRNLPARDFVLRYLVEKLGVRQVFVGYDYAFGKERKGNPSLLKELGKKYGFGVKVILPVKQREKIIKSSLIRELVSGGNFNRAVKLLNSPYLISGKAVKGRGVGRRIGFPTANLDIADCKLIPAQGVYVGKLEGKCCVINIGSRPTFGENPSAVEVHIPGFNGNLNGKTLKVGLFYRLREERQFSDVEKLRGQIKKDIARAIRICYNSKRYGLKEERKARRYSKV